MASGKRFSDYMIGSLLENGWQQDVMRDGLVNVRTGAFVGYNELMMMNPDKMLPKLAELSKPNPLLLPNRGMEPGPEKPFVYPDEHKLKVRLGIRPVDKLPWDNVTIVRGSQKLHVILVFNDCNEITVIEDDPVLFPSDGLVAKLRMHRNF